MKLWRQRGTVEPSAGWHAMHVAALFIGVVALLGAGLATAVAQSSDERATDRLSGPSRFETAAAISRHAFPDGAPVVYLARADEPADALAGGSLTRGPVLLVPSCGQVPASVLAEIGRLDPTTVIALGGRAAVCDDVLARAAGGRQGAPPPPEGHQPDDDEPAQQPSPRDFDVQIAHVEPNPPGGEDQADEGEYVELGNTGDEPRPVGDWYLLDADDNYMSIAPGYEIPPGGVLRVYSGHGTNTASRYYNRRSPMLGNDGDTIRLFRSNGDLIDTFTY